MAPMSYETRRQIAIIVMEILQDDDEGIENLPESTAIEYGHAIADKLEEEGLLKEETK